MSKYQLVASHYNLYSKGNKYERQTIVEIPGVDLSTLQKIDNYTANKTEVEILIALQKLNPKYEGLNHLAIKYTKNKNSLPTFYRVISNNPEFVLCTENNKLKVRYFNGKQSRTLTVPVTELFLKEKTKLLQLLEEKNLEGFKEKYPYDDNLTFLVTRYLNSPYENYDAYRQNIQSIMDEFSRYITFRRWIVQKEKNKNYTYNKQYQNHEKQEPTPTPKKEIKSTLKETPRIKPTADNQDDNQITMFDFANENNIDLGVNHYYTKRRR